MIKHVQIARAEVACGAGELVVDNGGPWVAKYVGAAWDLQRPKNLGNWCAYFASWCLLHSGAVADLPPRARRGAKALVREVAARGQWVLEPHWLEPVEHALPRAGDIICWNRGLPGSWMGHVGIVADYHPDTLTLVVIEGNAGPFPAKVRRKSYPADTWRRRLYGVARLSA